MNPWEASALEHQFSTEGSEGRADSATDLLIYPGLYSPSGFNILDILFRVANRPNPQIGLGAVDCSVALLVCNLQQEDAPIVYASDPFVELTGYPASEILGRNCRFLQAPGGHVSAGSAREHVDDGTIRRMRRALEDNTEIQLEVPNFKKDGTRFVNLLTMIPIRWDGEEFRYSVGFQCEK